MSLLNATHHHPVTTRPASLTDDAPQSTAARSGPRPPGGQPHPPPATDTASGTIGYRLTGRRHADGPPPPAPGPYLPAPTYAVAIVEQRRRQSATPRLPFIIAVVSATPTAESFIDEKPPPAQHHTQGGAPPPDRCDTPAPQAAPTASPAAERLLQAVRRRRNVARARRRRCAHRACERTHRRAFTPHVPGKLGRPPGVDLFTRRPHDLRGEGTKDAHHGRHRVTDGAADTS
jgi:hypothetical protein